MLKSTPEQEDSIFVKLFVSRFMHISNDANTSRTFHVVIELKIQALGWAKIGMKMQ